MLADKARTFPADPRVQEAMTYSGILDLAEPTLAVGETLTEFLSTTDNFDPNKAAERDFGYVRLHQLALDHLIG